ncbi:MAG: DUF2071 domain-containing protein [Pirellulales bacterium]
MSAAAGAPLAGRFLTAQWRWLAMANYEVPPALLAPYVPRGVELDDWRGKYYLSVVGFLFVQTRVGGIPVPGHRHFEELNLRFYVRRDVGNERRRGVVFIKELVPRRAIAWVARWIYNEPYTALPMRHELRGLPDPRTTPAGAPLNSPPQSRSVAYEWQLAGRWQALRLTAGTDLAPLVPGSEAEFITEHYWGYCRQRDGGTVEYQVEHVPWRVAHASSACLEADVASLYGPSFVEYLGGEPASAMLAEGSPIAVRRPRRLV